jgi:Ca2+-binding RTX toxin-like protein
VSTNDAGRARFGVFSPDSSFGSIYKTVESRLTTVDAWIDTTAGGVQQRDEPAARSTIHWSLPGRCTLVGTNADDNLIATSFPSKICGLGGDDVIEGLDGATGNDVVLGGPGNDTLRGRRGNDKLFGGSGNDKLFGGPGNDKLFGGPGNDRFAGGPGKDKVSDPQLARARRAP